MCLQSSTYHIVDQIKVGGVTSVLLLCMWVGNLILTLHHNSSWAVNEIGEVQMANIYYCTWATVLNAGLLMSSYVKKLFNSKPKALMVSDRLEEQRSYFLCMYPLTLNTHSIIPRTSYDRSFYGWQW